MKESKILHAKTSKILTSPDIEQIRLDLENGWCRSTTSPENAENWCRHEKALGQSDVTALFIQEKFGGVILYACVLPYYGDHYWNRLPDGTEVDLVCKQFAPDTIIPRGEIVSRKGLLSGKHAKAERRPQRYALFHARVEASIADIHGQVGPGM